MATPTVAPSPTGTTTIPAASNVNLTFGNPSGAGTTDLNNYLLEKPQYVVSYNCGRGIPNWVSWQLNDTWLGAIDRQDDFRPDNTLPAGCYAVRPTDDQNSGYDRGHMAPLGDRPHCRRWCSTPYGINGWDIYLALVYHRPVFECSTPYGINGWDIIVARLQEKAGSPLLVLNALRHQWLGHTDRIRRVSRFLIVLNALRHQWLGHLPSPSVPPPCI